MNSTKDKTMAASKLKPFLLGLFSILAVQIAFAQNENPPNNGTGSFGGNILETAAAIENLVGGYGTKQLGNKHPTELFYQTSDAVYNILIGSVFNSILSTTSTQNYAGYIPVNPNYNPNSSSSQATLTDQAIYNLLTVTSSTAANQNIQIPAPMPAPSSSALTAVFGSSSSQNSNQPPTQNFDLTSLLGPIQYDYTPNASSYSQTPGPQQTAAMNFITFAGNLANPPPTIDFSSLSQSKFKAAMQDKDVIAYLLALRSYAAQESVGLGNLYHLYAERVPVNTQSLKSSGQYNAIKGAGLYPEASPLMVDNYMATRRFTDPAWNTTMQQLATPAELMRQSNYLLQELLYQSYENRLLNERILATLSVMELQGAQTQTINLVQLYNTVRSKSFFNPNNSTPASTN